MHITLLHSFPVASIIIGTMPDFSKRLGQNVTEMQRIYTLPMNIWKNWGGLSHPFVFVRPFMFPLKCHPYDI